MIDSRAIFGYFRDPKIARPTDKKEGHEIDSFKGNLSKNTEFRKKSTKIVSLACVLDPKMSKFYGTFHSRSPFTSIIRDGFEKSSVLVGVQKMGKMGKFYATSDSRFSFT